MHVVRLNIVILLQGCGRPGQAAGGVPDPRSPELGGRLEDQEKCHHCGLWTALEVLCRELTVEFEMECKLSNDCSPANSSWVVMLGVPTT